MRIDYPNFGTKQEPQAPQDVATPEEQEAARKIGCRVRELRGLDDPTPAGRGFFLSLAPLRPMGRRGAVPRILIAECPAENWRGALLPPTLRPACR